MTPLLNQLQQVLAFGNNALLQAIGIIVLIWTLFAVNKQAKASVKGAEASTKQAIASEKQAAAADKLTEATERQIQTSIEQAKAAKEQVEVARRQIVEAVRPILLLQNSPTPVGGSSLGLELVLQNEGQGVALDVWWTYGKATGMKDQRNSVRNGIVASGKNRSFMVHEPRMVGGGILVVYESLAGVVCATEITWTGRGYHEEYLPDVTEWARKLLGRPLGPTN